MTGKVDRDMDSVGTPHFAQFVPLEDQQLGFFTVYDGAFDKYIMDFTKNIGPASMLFGNSPRTRRRRLAANTSRNSSTSRPPRAVLLSASIKVTPAWPIRISRR